MNINLDKDIDVDLDGDADVDVDVETQRRLFNALPRTSHSEIVHSVAYAARAASKLLSTLSLRAGARHAARRRATRGALRPAAAAGWLFSRRSRAEGGGADGALGAGERGGADSSARSVLEASASFSPGRTPDARYFGRLQRAFDRCRSSSS